MINGSQTEPSRSRALLDAAADVMATMGAEPARWYAGPGGESAHAELRELANAAAAVVLVTPVYHNSFSGALKSALDHLNAGHLTGKPVALMSTGGTYNCQAIDQLRIVVGAMRGVVVPTHLIATDADFAYLVDGYQLTGPKLRSRLVDLIEELIWFTGRLQDRPATDDATGAATGPADAAAQWKDVGMSAPRPWNGQLSEAITRAVSFIRDNYDDSELTLDSVAREAHISRFHFSRSFKAQTGRRFIDYLTMLRLSRARTLLAETDDSVTAICHAVGYRDLSHFERTFKGWFALSPSEFRRRQRTSTAAAPAPPRRLPAPRGPEPIPLRPETLASSRRPA
ncbi:helix-turn-helix domain-containing protein [Jidongwangia harbinensis]|uniref:helix-turn-helix domain-containing protein n=1 Tax=Jidongwangia harbinensis TaxID=2878561 RepID=UPI001CDA213C|nr:helix-turn-helix domain-containing protein [Jidongwangia harbinensis]MCA2218283.1 helix-turn-helix domain-containing protein [Jidongwangia harbinensis]